MLVPGSSEARIADASDALEALIRDHDEYADALNEHEQDTSKDDRITELESDLEDAHTLLADLREHIKLLEENSAFRHKDTEGLLRRVKILTGEASE
jgi:predicted  nucleic acid-binding Zn-ribbon protein